MDERMHRTTRSLVQEMTVVREVDMVPRRTRAKVVMPPAPSPELVRVLDRVAGMRRWDGHLLVIVAQDAPAHFQEEVFRALRGIDGTRVILDRRGGVDVEESGTQADDRRRRLVQQQLRTNRWAVVRVQSTATR
jgi:hypothetical protein